MPHKRAKRSIREKLRAEKKSDLPPAHGLISEDMPKAMARILNAEATQKAWRERKRLVEEGGDLEERQRKKRKTQRGSEQTNQSAIQIKLGESLRHFNRRVEDDMRPLVRTAMKSTTSVSKQKAKASERDDPHNVKKREEQRVENDSDNEDNHTQNSKAKESAKDFAQTSSSQPKRLNDIALAPPDLKVAPRLKRLAAAAQMKSLKSDERSEDGNNVSGAVNGVVSIAQKRMMELEREKAIRRYRALKEAKAKGSRAIVQGAQ